MFSEYQFKITAELQRLNRFFDSMLSFIISPHLNIYSTQINRISLDLI